MDCYEQLLEELDLISELVDALADEKEAIRKYDRILGHNVGLYNKKRDLSNQIKSIKQDELRHSDMLLPFIQKFTKEHVVGAFKECLYDRGITQADREQARVSVPSYKLHPKR